MKEISLDLLSKFENIFAIDKEKHIVILMTIKTFRRRFQLYPELKKKAKLYALCDDWEKEGIFFMTFLCSEKQCDVYFDCIIDSIHHLNIIKKALTSLDFRLMTFLCSVRNAFRETIFELQNEMNLIIHEDTNCVCFHMSLENALGLTYEIPSDYKIRELTSNNIDKINNAWPYRFEQSEFFIDYTIKYHVNVGLFDNYKNLIAWCLRYDNGSRGILQVDGKHLRKGFGELVVRAIVKKIVKNFNCDLIALVIPENEKSMKLFKKLGFEMLSNHTYFGLKTA